MYSNSTSTLRGCLRIDPTIHGRHCRRETRLHGPVTSVFLARRSLHRPTHIADEAAESTQAHSVTASTTSTYSSQSQIAETFSDSTAPLPVESRVQSVRPRPVRYHTWDGAVNLRKAATLSNDIYGRDDRLSDKHGPSMRLVARKLKGPYPISVLQREDSGRKGPNKWSYPPAWRSIAIGPEHKFGPTTQHVVGEYSGWETSSSLWRMKYLELYFQSRNGGAARAREQLDVHRQVAISFVGDRSLEELREAWYKMPLASKKRHLASILLGCLADSARKTLLMLSLDFSTERDWRTRCECLCYLDLVYRGEIDADPYLQDLFDQHIKRVSHVWMWPEEIMPWHFLVLLLRHNGREHCDNMIDTVFQYYDPVPPRLILVMVDHHTKHGQAERALELLSRIPPEQREQHKVGILQRCANLVLIDTIDKSDHVGKFRALPNLIKLGLPIDGSVYNRIIERAITLGMPQVAWEVFRFMDRRKILIDERSHLFLLKDSFERNDRNQLDIIMSAIHERPDLYQYPYLVTYMMHIVRVVCTIDRKAPPEVSVSHLLAIYDRVYDRSPLVKLGITNALPVTYSSMAQLRQPPPTVLGFTIWAYVLSQRDERLISALWFWIVHMIKQQDESILACAQYDTMYNSFIHFYARSHYSLGKAVDVVEAMIDHDLCQPTERTWSEVLCGFLKHGENETAEKIWRMMLARKLQPSEERWRFLMEKYDASQLAELVRYVLDERRMPDGRDKASGRQVQDAGATTSDTEHIHAQEDLAEYKEAGTGRPAFERSGGRLGNTDSSFPDVYM